MDRLQQLLNMVFPKICHGILLPPFLALIGSPTAMVALTKKKEGR